MPVPLGTSNATTHSLSLIFHAHHVCAPVANDDRPASGWVASRIATSVGYDSHPTVPRAQYGGGHSARGSWSEDGRERNAVVWSDIRLDRTLVGELIGHDNQEGPVARRRPRCSILQYRRSPSLLPLVSACQHPAHQEVVPHSLPLTAAKHTVDGNRQGRIPFDRVRSILTRRWSGDETVLQCGQRTRRPRLCLRSHQV